MRSWLASSLIALAACGSSSMNGDDSAPTSADYDWIRVYDWVPDGT